MGKYVSHLSYDGNKLPLTVHDWKYMPSEFIENCILEVKQIFDVPDKLNDWIKLKLNERWKNHKILLKMMRIISGQGIWNNVLLIHQKCYPDEVLMDPEVAAEIEVEYQASQPGSHIVLQGRNDSFARIRGRDKGGRVRCLSNVVKPKKYWG
ncbi:hypothetical protein MKX01_010227 [Papaver californicum]|nr:hypothetical protein MKX01_010227 [Papaver californicum]